MAMTLTPKPNHPNGKRFATIKELKEKSKQELHGDTKHSVSDVFGKNPGKSVLYLRGITLKGTG